MNRSIAGIVALCGASGLLSGCLETATSFECDAVLSQQASVRGDSVVTTSGLIYRELAVGSGAEVQSTDRCQLVEVGYVGRLTSGTVFSETPDGQVFRFVVGDRSTITGFEQGMVGMRVGGRRQLIIPPELGYGSEAQTQGPVQIPANSTLVFDVELVSLQD